MPRMCEAHCSHGLLAVVICSDGRGSGKSLGITKHLVCLGMHLDLCLDPLFFPSDKPP